MGRAILIDDFLSESDFSSITEKVVESEYWSNDTLGDYLRDDLWDATTNLVFKRLKEINLFEEKFFLERKEKRRFLKIDNDLFFSLSLFCF